VCFSGHGSEFLSSPGNQQWMNHQQRTSPKQPMIKPPSIISPDPFQTSIPTTIQSNPSPNPPRMIQSNPSPSCVSRIPSHSAMPNDQSSSAHQQRPPSVARTPTTPSQNSTCSFPFADDLSGRAGFATPSPSNTRKPSTTPVDQRFQNDQNSLRKLQQLTFDKDTTQSVEPNAASRKRSCQGPSNFSSTNGTRRQRYRSVGIHDRPSNVQQARLANIHASYQTSVTPPERASRINQHHQFGNYGEIQHSPVHNKDFGLQKVNFGSTSQGLRTQIPDCPWPAYPPNLSRQQSAPPYSHFPGSMHEQSRIGIHQYQQYGASGVNFPADSASGSLNPAHCAFPTGLPATYQHQALMARSSRDYPSNENYYHPGDFGPPGHMTQGDGTVSPNLFNSGQPLGAYSQQTNPYYNSYGGVYK